MKSISKHGVLVLVAVCIAAVSFGGVSGPDKGRKLQKINDYKYLNINTINCAMNSDGVFADERKTGASGMEWPKGSGKTCVFTAGLWLAGKHQPDGLIRTANMDYQSEYQPGPLLETFNTSANDDALPVSRAGDPRYRLYKITKSDLKANAAPNADLTEWPGDLGAPYIDVNNNGVFDAGIDQPKWYGDQQIWCVINDVCNSRHAVVGATQPLGMEVRCLYFAFNRPGALGNMMFLKWQIINKSDADYDSVYISMWSDVDLGDANDDLPGCDTTLSLGYVYNGTNNDQTTHGYGTKPPADGFDFFEGPKVPAGPADSALVDGKWTKGYVNLPMTSYVVYTNATFAQIVDPPTGSPNYPLIAYDYQRGLAGTVHQTLISKTSGLPMYKWFSGDPVAGTGDLPSNFPLGTFNPQDIRIMLSSGPFNLAKGDTQEVVGAFLIAQGADRLASVTLLKQYDFLAQDAFNSNFNLPSAPPLPTIKLTTLPNQLIFDWHENSDTTEAYNYKNYLFQGYNFYQGESANGPWTRLATYDLVDTIGVIVDYVQNPTDGNYYLNPVEYGTNSGLQHTFNVDHDYLTGNPLVNGQQYFFALTTYAYNITEGARDKGIALSLEAPQDAIISIPRQPEIGTTLPSSTNQVLVTDRGMHSDDALKPTVFDPTLLTGDTYTVVVNGTGTNVTSWDMIRQSATGTDTVVHKSTYFTGDNNSPYVDGIIVKLVNPPQGPRSDSQTPAGAVYVPSYKAWLTAYTVYQRKNYTMSVPQTALGVWYPYYGLDMGPLGSKGTSVTKDNLKKVEIRFTAPGQGQHAYRYLNKVHLSGGAGPYDKIIDSSFLPYINATGLGFVYQHDYATVTVPFTVWEVDSLDGDPTPRQLNVGFIETNDSVMSKKTGKYAGFGRIDGQWDPTTADNGGMEPVFIFSSTYSTVENPKYTVANLQKVQDSVDIMYGFLAKSTDSLKTFQDHTGEKIVITPSYALDGGRTFIFTAPKIQEGDPAAMKRDLNLINVFPNPYFAHNTAETGLFNHWVTFSHLPAVARIRIFAISGELVRDIAHSNTTTFDRWDLRNTNGLPVASGVYLVHIEIPGVGNRILKVALVMPEDRPQRI
jgi:hypothetical protein